MPEEPFPIVRVPRSPPRAPVLVSVPHFGTEAIPGIRAEDYANPADVSLPWGYADTFAADVYGDAHEFGACVVATPYSRLFVDVNRRRDDFACENEIVTSKRGVLRTHTIRDKAIFSRPLERPRAEELLARFYDPYHATLRRLVEEMRRRHGRVVVLDAHTGSPNRMGAHEVVVGTRQGSTAPRPLIERIKATVSAAGFEVHEDVPGYAGGHIVRRYGEDGSPEVYAVQIEINAGLLMTTPRDELVSRMRRGERPERHDGNIERARRCLEAIIAVVAA